MYCRGAVSACIRYNCVYIFDHLKGLSTEDDICAKTHERSHSLHEGLLFDHHHIAGLLHSFFQTLEMQYTIC